MDKQQLPPDELSTPRVPGAEAELRHQPEPGPPIPLPPTPPPGSPIEDGKVYREKVHVNTYLIAGGAKFLVPSNAELQALGFSESDVLVVSEGGLDNVPTVPRDGALLKERTGDTVFVMHHGVKYAVRDEMALGTLKSPHDKVYTVPKGGLERFSVPKIPVLETDAPQPDYPPPSSTDWSSNVAGGKQWLANDPPRRAWIPVLDPSDQYDRKLVGVSGTTVHSQLSGSDMPFTHPFGNDWECWIAVDPGKGYEIYLAHSNDGNAPEGGEYAAAYNEARRRRLPTGEKAFHRGLLGVEWSDMFNVDYRPEDGDRIVVFGRWIVDAGHTDFHTEIHPPLLMAKAAEIEPSITRTTVVGRPYLVNQTWPEGSLRAHFEEELKKASTFRSLKIEAHPAILPQPFSGRHVLGYLVRTADPSKPKPDARLGIRWGLTVRSGVEVKLERADSRTIRVSVTMDEANYTPPPLPPREGRDIDLGKLMDQADVPWWVHLLKYSLAVVALHRSVGTDWRRAPFPPQPPRDGHLLWADSLPQSIPVHVDDNQPYPIAGFITIAWGTPPTFEMKVTLDEVDKEHYRVRVQDSGTGEVPSGARVFVDGVDVGVPGEVLSYPPRRRVVIDRKHQKFGWAYPPAFVKAPNYPDARIDYPNDLVTQKRK